MKVGTKENSLITLQIADHLPHVHGNEEMLKQCLINLIKNAQEAMEEGVITVCTRYVDDTVYLEVGDNGPGIPEELQEKIFSPFFSTKDKGAGLGLAMTRKIINEIGGKLLLHSNVGQGTLVSMGLRPVLAVEDDTAPTPGETQ
jgi:signal transduction histidine kinase